MLKKIDEKNWPKKNWLKKNLAEKEFSQKKEICLKKKLGQKAIGLQKNWVEKILAATPTGIQEYNKNC